MKLKFTAIPFVAVAMLVIGCTPNKGTPGHTHQWGDPTYVWAGDNSTCTATRVCTLDETHVEDEVSRASYKIVTQPTETVEGLGRYTAKFSNKAFATQTKDVTIPTISVVDSYESAVTSITTKHNYSAHLNNQWANETNPFVDYNYFNINNDAMFDDYNAYFYSGYVKQKGQGIVNFKLNKSATTSSGLILGDFVATNTERDISDIYTLAVEHLADKEFSYDSELGLYKSTSMDAMAVLANLGFGDYTSLVSAPEYITAKFENGVLTYRGVFDVNYFDEVEVHTTGDVTLVVSNFEKTHNSVLESYVVTPDYTYTAPTSWDKDTTDLFTEYFNGVIPPFIQGISYAWKSGVSGSEGSDVTMVEDYFGGDLTINYRTLLEAEGYREVENLGLIEYQKVVEEEYIVHTYSVKMKYYAPADTDSDDMEYGYLYPNGVSSFKFLHKQKTKDVVTTVSLLNQYIKNNTAAGDYLPVINLAGDTRVANFSDATGTREGYVTVLKGTNSEFFKIYPDTKEHAVAAVEQFVTALEALGFTTERSTSFQQYWMSDSHFSVIKITDPSYATTWSSTTHLQVSYAITEETLAAWQEEPVTLGSIAITGQKITWTVGDTFTFDGTVTATYSNGTTEIVTPTSVTTPDMSSAGQKVIQVSYTNSKNETVSCDYTINVNSAETLYDINVIQVTGATIAISYPPTSLKSQAGHPVNFTVDVNEGYELLEIIATYSEGSVEVSGPIPPTNNAYTLTMPAGDLTLTVRVGIDVPSHNISYVVKDMDTDEVLDYNTVIGGGSTLPKSADENSVVNFSVALKTGYTFNRAEIGTTVFTNASFMYMMGTEDLAVTIYVKVDEGGSGGDTTEFGGTYSWFKGKLAGYDTYFRLTFDVEHGTGTFVKDQSTGGGPVYTIYFSFTLNGDRLTLTLTDTGSGFSNFGTYRPFDYDNIGNTNATGVINPDGSISIDLYNAAGSSGAATSSGNYAFRK